MATRRTAAAGPAQSYATVIVAAAALLAVAGTVLRLPGVLVVWGSLIGAGWFEQAPLFTGKKDPQGFPTPAHPGEQMAMNTFRFWKDLRWRLIVPSTDWLPGWPVLGSWLAAVGAAALTSFAPIRPDLPAWAVWLNVAAAYISVAQVVASRRRTVAEDDPCPGTRVDTLARLVTGAKKDVISLAVATVAVVAVVAYAALVLVPQVVTVSGPLGRISFAFFPVITGLVAAGAVVAHPWQKAALVQWRELVQVRRQWAPRWQALKQDPAPRLVAHRTVGPATVDTFEAAAAVGAAFYYAQAAKITPTLGANVKVAVLDVANEDGQGQAVPGTMHPTRFEVAMWPADQFPDVSEQGTDPQVAELLVRSAMAWAVDMVGFARFVLTGCDLVSADGSPSVWATQWAPTMEIGLDWVRKQAMGAIASAARTGILIDHRAMGWAGRMFVGAVTDPQVEFDDGSGVTTQGMAELAEEDTWRGWWAAALKQNVNAPVPQFAVKAEGQLADGTTVHYQPFVTLSGEDPAQFMGLEGKLAAAIAGSPPFCSISWFTQRGGNRAGERHAQAIAVAWADRPVPSIQALGPVRGQAAQWVIAGHMNDAFVAARLPRPEVLSAKCLTSPQSREHIWQVSLRLYGGVTLADVRGVAGRLRTQLGCVWLRVAPSPEGATVFAGGEPGRVRLARPEKDVRALVSLDWEQAWLDSKVSGSGGLTPTLTDVDSLPKNDQVQVLDFDLPPGLSVVDLKAATDKLKTATSNAFIDVRPGVGGASTVRLLVCEVSPMPDFAEFDWAAIDEAEDVPFATGIEGEAVSYDYLRDPHLLVVGGTGSGKSATLQTLLYPLLVHGCDVYIADPTKGGADFRFATPWVKALTAEVFEASAMMNAVYAEVVRRKDLNAEYGVGSYLELPEDVRPPHAIVVLDEFTSLMMTEPVARPDVDDEAGVREYEHAVALNNARRMIGSKAGRIAREARSAGVTLLLATQRLTAKTLDQIPGASDLRTNMSRLILGKATFGELQSALKDPQAAPPIGDVVPRGRGLLEMSGVPTQIIQSWFVPEIQRVLAERLAERRDPLREDERLDLSPFMPQQPGDEDADDAPREPRVVDLGELEMSMDDLLEFDEAHTDTAQASEGTPASDTVGAAPSTVLLVDPTAVDIVEALGHVGGPAEVLVTAPAEGGTVLQEAEGQSGWGRLDGLVAHLAERFPEVDKVVWVDPALGDLDDLEVERRAVAADVLDTIGVEHELVVPETAHPVVCAPDVGPPPELVAGEEPADPGAGRRLLAPIPDEW